ncbi:MAG: DUF3300 domain-containing protein [Burkholderiaceae bacterium]
MKNKLATCLTLSLAFGLPPALQAQSPAPPPAPQGATAPAPYTQGELEQMLAPIALYPDALLSQMLMASTYPLEIVEAARWRKEHASLQGDALQSALQQQSWDESVKSLTAFPDVLERMNKDLAWTQKLGDAFLGQQQQMLDTVQTLRKKAQTAGTLQSNDKQKVETQTQEGKQVIVIEPANPQVVYVPTYQPTVVYGAWGYPAYPPYYPSYWYPPGAAFASGFFWGVGIAAGAALWGGVNWGGGDVNIDIDRHNNFNRTNISNKNWEHKSQHRGSVPYRDAGSREKFKATDRQAAAAREQFRGRDEGLGGGGLNDRAGLNQAHNNPAVRDAAARDRAGAGAGTHDRGSGPGGATAGTRDLGGADRGGGGGIDRGGAGGVDRGGAGGAGAANRASPATADRGGAFSGGNGAQTRAASNRGHSSMGSAGGGRPAGGGGARAGGGGGRGGGGRR